MRLMLGADCVVRNAAGQVLLVKREDFRVWTIPGGGGDPGEAPSQIAVRETLEESGVEAAIEELVGVYTFQDARNLMFVYSGHPVGGELRTSFESVDVRYFRPDVLPTRMLHLHRQRLLDGLSDARGFVRYQPFPLWAKLMLPTLIQARRLRNRLRGHPEVPPVWREVRVLGVLPGNGAGPRQFEVTRCGSQPVWEALRQQASRELDAPVAITRVLDAQQGADGVVAVRFELQAD